MAGSMYDDPVSAAMVLGSAYGAARQANQNAAGWQSYAATLQQELETIRQERDQLAQMVLVCDAAGKAATAQGRAVFEALKQVNPNNPLVADPTVRQRVFSEAFIQRARETGIQDPEAVLGHVLPR